jgi:thiamine pyrophosphokinase
MKKQKKRRKIIKEIDSEDWCFVCKDGGALMICDYGWVFSELKWLILEMRVGDC